MDLLMRTNSVGGCDELCLTPICKTATHQLDKTLPRQHHIIEIWAIFELPRQCAIYYISLPPPHRSSNCTNKVEANVSQLWLGGDPMHWWLEVT